MMWRKSSRSNGQADCVEVAWRTSSRSNGQANCVEIARMAKVVAVRDSKNTSGPVLSFPVSGWAAFLQTGN
jgi:uncharacterized membrane protein